MKLPVVFRKMIIQVCILQKLKKLKINIDYSAKYQKNQKCELTKMTKKEKKCSYIFQYLSLIISTINFVQEQNSLQCILK